MRAGWLASLILLLLPGCGITEEVHTQTIRDLDKCRQDLSTTRSDLERVQLEGAAEKTRVAPEQRPAGQPSEKELAELARMRDAAQRRVEQGRQLAAALAPLIQAGTLKMGEHRGRAAVAVPEKNLFEPGRAELKAGADAVLARIASALRDLPDRELLIAGHTAPEPVARGSKFRSNWELSTARAVAVVQFLQNEGIDPRRMGAVGFSEFDSSEPSPLGEAGAGRVEIILAPSAAELPLPTGGI